MRPRRDGDLDATSVLQRGRAEHLCFVIGSQPPYCYDFNEILGLPDGFTFRNRFHEKWVEPGLRPTLHDLTGQATRVLLILRDAEKNTLIPVRWGTITSIQRVGVVWYFEYTLGKLIRYEADGNIVSTQVESFTSTIHSAHNWLPGRENQLLNESEPSVFLTTVGGDFKEASADDLEAWGNLAGAVTTADVFLDTEFLKIVSLEDSKGSKAVVFRNGFLVNPRETYHLKVFQSVPRPSGNQLKSHTIRCNSLGDDIEFLRGELQAVGKYDMLTFVLRPVSGTTRTTTALEIPFNPDASAAMPRVKAALFIPLTFAAPSTAQKAGTWAIILVSLFAVFYPKVLETLIPLDVTRNIAMLVLLVILAGPSKALQSLWPSIPSKG